MVSTKQSYTEILKVIVKYDSSGVFFNFLHHSLGKFIEFPEPVLFCMFGSPSFLLVTCEYLQVKKHLKICCYKRVSWQLIVAQKERTCTKCILYTKGIYKRGGSGSGGSNVARFTDYLSLSNSVWLHHFYGTGKGLPEGEAGGWREEPGISPVQVWTCQESRQPS